MESKEASMRITTWITILTIASPVWVLSCDVSSGQVPDLPGWDLIWNDEFEGPTVDTAAWELLDRKNSHNNEKQYYLPEQISIDNGNLRITATNEPFDGKAYRSGRMWTWGEWSYGRFEARAKLPTTQGMWPAFWLNPRGVNWPTGGEIDIMENRGSEPFQTSSAYHWGASVGAHQYASNHYSATEDGAQVNFHDSFHTYAVEWDPGILRYYVDGNLHFIVDETVAPIHDTPKSIILNLAVGGFFDGDPDGSTVFPQHFDIDYVRVWERNGQMPIELLNSSFESGMAGWDQFGNTVGNVKSSGLASSDGNRSMKTYGQFSGVFNSSGAYQGLEVTPGTKLRANVEALSQSGDSLIGTANYANLKLEYYSTFGADYGSADFLGEKILRVADGTTTEDVWNEYELTDIVPSDAVEARMTLVYVQPNNEGGSVYFDATSLEALSTADFDLDGFVDADDLAKWQADAGVNGNSDADFDGDSDGADFLAWQQQFSAASAVTTSHTIPEPSSSALLFGVLICLFTRRCECLSKKHSGCKLPDVAYVG